MQVHEVTDEGLAPHLATFGEDIDPAARCNAAAVRAGLFDLTYLNADQAATFIADPDHVVLVAESAGGLVGYAVIRDGGRIRWLIMSDQESAESVMEAVAAVARESVARFGACFGRVSNVHLRQLLLRIPEVHAREVDPEVLDWWE